MSTISLQQQNLYSYLNLQIEDSVKTIKEKKSFGKGISNTEEEQNNRQKENVFLYSINELSPQVIAEIHYLKENDIISTKNNENDKNSNKKQNTEQISLSERLYLGEYATKLYNFVAQMNNVTQTTIEYMYKNNQSFDYKV